MNFKQELECLEIVAELNWSILEDELKENTLEFCSNGFCCLIKFLDNIIWSSENEEREFLEDKDDYEPLKEYVIKKYNEMIDLLQKQKIK